MARLLFISDLHLSEHTPEGIEWFLRFLRTLPIDVQGLYILGDWFDAWIGDDDDAPYLSPIYAQLKKTTRRTAVFVQHGNRDFLIGKDFAQSTGIHLLPEEQLLDVGKRRILLMHGDTLCTDDKDYLQARRQLRDPDFIRQFLAQPLAQRRRLACEYRKLSGEATSNKAAEIMDVNQQTVVEKMRRHQAHCLLHGHTHRPNVHRFELDERIAERWVLGAWPTPRHRVLQLQLDSGQLTAVDC